MKEEDIKSEQVKAFREFMLSTHFTDIFQANCYTLYHLCVSSTKHSKLVSFAHMKLYFKTFSFKMNPTQTKLAVAKTIKAYQTTAENEWNSERLVQQ